MQRLRGTEGGLEGLGGLRGSAGAEGALRRHSEEGLRMRIQCSGMSPGPHFSKQSASRPSGPGLHTLCSVLSTQHSGLITQCSVFTPRAVALLPATYNDPHPDSLLSAHGGLSCGRETVRVCVPPPPQDIAAGPPEVGGCAGAHRPSPSCPGLWQTFHRHSGSGSRR